MMESGAAQGGQAIAQHAHHQMAQVVNENSIDQQIHQMLNEPYV